jgi:hypothetical protein
MNLPVSALLARVVLVGFAALILVWVVTRLFGRESTTIERPSSSPARASNHSLMSASVTVPPL